MICIKVKDSGIGMDKVFLDKIFEKFSQEEKSTARKFGGTGLGMNISKELIHLMGGELSITSEKGVGTTVSICIPFKVVDQQFSKEAEKSYHDFELLKDKRVLVAEDNELNQFVIEATLSHYGVHLEFAENGKEAISLLKKNKFALVLMDIQMPIMNGIEACKFIRQNISQDLPIIAMTANVFKEDKQKYIAAGMNDIVPKPFEEEEILEVMMKWANQGMSMPSEDGMEDDTISYSLTKLKEISRGNQEFVKRMLDIFYKQSLETIDKMNSALLDKDKDAIARLAHKIKPSLDNMKIEVLSKKVRELEKLDDQKDFEEISHMVQLFCGMLDKAVKLIQSDAH